MTFDLTAFQDEQRAWAEHNFGPVRNPVHAAIGVAEEVGELAWAINHGIESKRPLDFSYSVRDVMLLELVSAVGNLCHVDLKEAQGIRKMSYAERRYAVVDDIKHLISLYAEHAFDGVDLDKDAVEQEISSVSEKCRTLTEEEMKAKVADAIGDLVVYSSDLATGIGVGLEGCIEGAWNDVRERDWKAFPQNGVTA